MDAYFKKWEQHVVLYNISTYSPAYKNCMIIAGQGGLPPSSHFGASHWCGQSTFIFNL